MAEKKNNKGMIFKREVCKVILQDERGYPNLTNCESENVIGRHKERYFESDTKMNEREIHRTYTEKTINYKTNTSTGKDDYTCEVCDVVCSGIENFKLHINGKKHNKNLKKLNILKEMKTFPLAARVTTYTIHEQKFTDMKECMQVKNGKANQELLSLKSQMATMRLEDPVRSAGITSCTKSECDCCEIYKKHFASKRAYYPHLEKSEHFKNKELMMKNIEINPEDDSMPSCGTCSKELTGRPYQQHLLRSFHIKNKEKINEVSYIPHSSGMSCEDCNMKFSGIIPFDDHLKGSSHRRQMRNKHMLAKLEQDHPDVLKIRMPRIYEEDVEPGERHRKLLKNEMFNKQDVQERNLLQFSDSDDSSDDVLLEL